MESCHARIRAARPLTRPRETGLFGKIVSFEHRDAAASKAANHFRSRYTPI
jgi:hypothetical protein